MTQIVKNGFWGRLKQTLMGWIGYKLDYKLSITVCAEAGEEFTLKAEQHDGGRLEIPFRGTGSWQHIEGILKVPYNNFNPVELKILSKMDFYTDNFKAKKEWER